MSIPAVFIIIIITMLFMQCDSESHAAKPKKVNIMKKKEATAKNCRRIFLPYIFVVTFQKQVIRYE